MKHITKEQRRKAAVAAAWIDSGYPDYFARCIKKGRSYYTNAMNEEPFEGELKRITYKQLIDLYEMLKETNAEEIAEIEGEMA